MKPDAPRLHDGRCLDISASGNIDFATSNLSNRCVRPRSNVSSGTPKGAGGPAASSCSQQAVRSYDLRRWTFRPGIGLSLIGRSFEGSAAFRRRQHFLPGNTVWKIRTAVGRFLCPGDGTGCQNQNGHAKGRKFEADHRSSGWAMTESKKSQREFKMRDGGREIEKSDNN